MRPFYNHLHRKVICKELLHKIATTMPAHQEGFGMDRIVDSLINVTNENEFRGAIASFLRRYEISHFAYVQIPKDHTLISEHKIFPRVVTNFPDGYMKDYKQSGAFDRALSLDVVESGNWLWWRDVEGKKRELVNIGLKYGLNEAIIAPLYGSEFNAVIALATDQEPDHLWRQIKEYVLELTRFAYVIHWFAQTNHKLLDPPIIPGLSERGIEFIRYKICGFTAAEIAQYGGVTEGAVRKMLQRLYRRFHVHNAIELAHLLSKFSVI